MAMKRRVTLWWRKRTGPAADFYILVMDIWAGDDPHAWLYSASAKTQEELLALPCYEDPPRSMHRATFASVSRTRVQLPCCTRATVRPASETSTKLSSENYGPPEWGTVHGMRHV